MRSKFDAAHSEYWTIDSNQAVQGYLQDPAWMTTFVRHSLPGGSSVLGEMKIAKRTLEAKLRGISFVTASLERNGNRSARASGSGWLTGVSEDENRTPKSRTPANFASGSQVGSDALLSLHPNVMLREDRLRAILPPARARAIAIFPDARTRLGPAIAMRTLPSRFRQG